eukprot:NODE_247_length_2605_cov_26.489045_g225_i0.p1 GENE.NODE_247_length_2605_cov_26.489045_g225_i0~~NODE_247_length_2605_cov_26.489045_g225_i0.p1  ORF type:complete len:756 (+),score=195.90 NODE_247_length_2605_cov_26.489045_g225_i0:151-2418(+)
MDPRNLEQMIQEQLMAPTIDDSAVREIVRVAQQESLQKEAFEVLKEPIKKEKRETQVKALLLLGRMIDMGDCAFAADLSTRKWMDRLVKVAKTKDLSVRDAVLQNIVNWQARFHDDAQFIDFNLAYNRLKAKGFAFPPPSATGDYNQATELGSSASASRSGPRTTQQQQQQHQQRAAPSGGGGSRNAQAAANADKVKVLMSQIQADLRSMEIGLQDPTRMPPHVVENCRRHQKKVMLVMSTDLQEAYTHQLIALYDQIGEYLEIYSAITQAEPVIAPTVRAERSGESSSKSAPPEGAHHEQHDSSELQEVKDRLQQAKAHRRQLDDESNRIRQQINDVRVKISMNQDDGGESENKKQKMLNMVRRTSTQSRGILANAKVQVTQLRQLFNSLRKEAEDFANAWTNDINYLNSMAEKAVKIEAKGLDTLKKLYLNEMQMRKKLYNKIQEFRGNTRIYCRARPLLPEEKSKGDAGADVTSFTSPTEIMLKDSSNRIFEVDGAFKPSDKTKTVFEDAAPILTCSLDGFNICMFAYGQTGAGKSYTVQGDSSGPGLLALSLEKLFEDAKERSETESVTIELAVFEIVNESIQDLIEPGKKNLQVQVSEQFGCYVDGLTQIALASPQDGMAKATAALRNREKSEQHTSKSALIFQFLVHSESTQTGSMTTGKVYLVELPGSERQDKMCQQLANVMEKIQQNVKNDQIPYRGCKLTHLLQDSLGGSSKQLFFVCISPSRMHVAASGDSLAYAFKVRGVILGK